MDLLETKNWRVSPMRGRPMEPGGSLPLHFGFLHLYTQWVMIAASKLKTLIQTDQYNMIDLI